MPVNIRLSMTNRPEPFAGTTSNNYIVAAGGQFLILPYPAANESGGIYKTKFARGVDPREVQSYFDNSRPLVPHSAFIARVDFIQASLNSLPSEAQTAATVNLQQERKSSSTLIRRFLRRKLLPESGRRRTAPGWKVTQVGVRISRGRTHCRRTSLG